MKPGASILPPASITVSLFFDLSDPILTILPFFTLPAPPATMLPAPPATIFWLFKFFEFAIFWLGWPLLDIAF